MNHLHKDIFQYLFKIKLIEAVNWFLQKPFWFSQSIFSILSWIQLRSRAL